MSPQIASLWAEISGNNAQLKSALTESKADMAGFAGEAKSAAGGIATAFLFTAAIAGVTALASGIGKAIDEYTAYAKVVREASLMTGQRTDAMSRTIQVANTLGISTEQLSTALTFAARKGIDVTISGLEELSTQYNALNTAQEKAKFLATDFGRSGEIMGLLMEKGATGIKTSTAAINDNLIITDKAAASTLQLQTAADGANKTFTGLWNTIASFFIPALTKLDTGLSMSLEKQNELAIAYGTGPFAEGRSRAIDDYIQAEIKLQLITDSLTKAGNKHALSTETYTRDELIATERMRGLEQQATQTARRISMLSDAEDKYTAAQKNVAAAQDDLKSKQDEWSGTTAKQVEDSYGKYIPDASKKTQLQMQLTDAAFGTNTFAAYKFQEGVNHLNWAFQNGQITADQYEAGLEGLKSAMPDTTSELEGAAGALADIQTQIKGILGLGGQIDIKVNVSTSGGAGGGGGPPSSSSGNTGVSGSYPHPKTASGGSFLIPAGYNENFQLGGRTASSGELVTVTPVGEKPVGNVYNQYAPIYINAKAPVDEVLKELNRL